MSWGELPIGGMIVEAGNSARRRTGEWRVFRPVIDQERCIRCLICWMYCPDTAIRIVDGKYTTKSGRVWDFSLEIDYDHCKGCGICVEECPIKVVDFVEEVR